jgi:hypothetical protein
LDDRLPSWPTLLRENLFTEFEFDEDVERENYTGEAN